MELWWGAEEGRVDVASDMKLILLIFKRETVEIIAGFAAPLAIPPGCHAEVVLIVSINELTF